MDAFFISCPAQLICLLGQIVRWASMKPIKTFMDKTFLKTTRVIASIFHHHTWHSHHHLASNMMMTCQKDKNRDHEFLWSRQNTETPTTSKKHLNCPAICHLYHRHSALKITAVWLTCQSRSNFHLSISERNKDSCISCSKFPLKQHPRTPYHRIYDHRVILKNHKLRLRLNQEVVQRTRQMNRQVLQERV